jgi:hypothetical protein
MKILVSVPNQGWIHKLVSRYVLELVLRSKHQITYIDPTWRPYEHNMNRIAKDFLAHGYDYWLNIDADNPPKGDILPAIDSGYDIVGFPTPVWHDGLQGLPYYWNAMHQKDDGFVAAQLPPGQLVPVDAVGSGCVLFNRRVVESVRKIYGPPFVRTVDEDGLVVFGPDYYFCKRAGEIGMSIAADTRCPCTHFVEIDMFSLTQKIANGGYFPRPSGYRQAVPPQRGDHDHGQDKSIGQCG